MSCHGVGSCLEVLFHVAHHPSTTQPHLKDQFVWSHEDGCSVLTLSATFASDSYLHFANNHMDIHGNTMYLTVLWLFLVINDLFFILATIHLSYQRSAVMLSHCCWSPA